MIQTQTKQPTANVTTNKGRLKIYSDNKVYLNSGQEFEIELYNPKDISVLAKISLNNQEIGGGGIMLRPGERVFLERFLDTDRKFKFDTYFVDGKNPDTKRAIKHNGKVKVEFYEEQINNSYNPIIINDNWNHKIDWDYYNQPVFGTVNNIFNSANVNKTNICSTNNLQSKKIETGRVEAGDKSDQKFEYVNKNFCYWPCATSEYQILPLSQKHAAVSDIRVYCTGCGKRAKPADNFCSKCGNKLK